MNYSYQFSVLPGDKRQDDLIDVLLAKGRIVAYDMPLPDLCKAAPVILGGIPSAYTFEELALQSGQTFVGGCLTKAFTDACSTNQIDTYDYMRDEVLTIQNAIATAEGTISEMIAHSPYNLHDSNVLILGFGTCAKALAQRLHALHMNVCICARNPVARAEALSMHYDAIPFEMLPGRLPGFLFIVNTVPSLILDEKHLAFVHPKCLLCDIASAPGGIDSGAAQALSIRTIKLPGLPGKYAPLSSAQFMADYIFKNVI